MHGSLWKWPSKYQSSAADGGLGPQIAAAPRPAGRIEDGDLVEQAQPPRSDARGTHVGARRLPAGTEAHVGTALGEGADRVGVEGGARAPAAGGSCGASGGGLTAAASHRTPPVSASSSSLKNPAWPSRTVSSSVSPARQSYSKKNSRTGPCTTCPMTRISNESVWPGPGGAA